MDPFEILGLPRRFGIDPKVAEARHLELSRALHPDRYASAPAGERRMALSRAIEVNEAWRAIRDPIARAEAVLRVAGLGDEIGETREPKPTGEFLMDVMERRERLADARAAKDAAAVKAVLVETRAEHAAVQTLLAKTIDDALEPSVDLPRLRAAIPLLGRLRYAARSLGEAIAADDALEGF